MAVLYIIAGPNGAGKTTASKNLLPKHLNCPEFLNADEIASQINSSNPEVAAIKAGREMLAKMHQNIERGVNFAIETTLASRSYLRMVNKAKEKGYKVVLLFFWLDSPEMAQQRVRQRVAEGGHNIPPDVIERRYWLGLENLFQLFMSSVNEWSVYDNNSGTILIANSDGEVNRYAYEDIVSRIPISNQIKFLEVANTRAGKVNWNMITQILEEGYEELLREKEMKSYPVVISRNGKPEKVSASSAFKMFCSNFLRKFY